MMRNNTYQVVHHYDLSSLTVREVLVQYFTLKIEQYFNNESL